MKKIDSQLESLERKVTELVALNQKLEDKVIYQEDKLSQKEQSLINLEKRYKDLEEENKRLKVLSAFSGDTEHKKMMKLYMNKIIKEVDACITDLKTQ